MESLDDSKIAHWHHEPVGGAVRGLQLTQKRKCAGPAPFLGVFLAAPIT
jgi:hypothetical protein